MFKALSDNRALKDMGKKTDRTIRKMKKLTIIVRDFKSPLSIIDTIHRLKMS